MESGFCFLYTPPFLLQALWTGCDSCGIFFVQSQEDLVVAGREGGKRMTQQIETRQEPVAGLRMTRRTFVKLAAALRVSAWPRGWPAT